MSRSLPFALAEWAAARRQINQDMARFADPRALEAVENASRLRILLAYCGRNQTTLAAAMAEQAAHTKLSDHVWRNNRVARKVRAHTAPSAL